MEKTRQPANHWLVSLISIIRKILEDDVIKNEVDYLQLNNPKNFLGFFHVFTEYYQCKAMMQSSDFRKDIFKTLHCRLVFKVMGITEEIVRWIQY